MAPSSRYFRNRSNNFLSLFMNISQYSFITYQFRIGGVITYYISACCDLPLACKFFQRHILL